MFVCHFGDRSSSFGSICVCSPRSCRRAWEQWHNGVLVEMDIVDVITGAKGEGADLRMVVGAVKLTAPMRLSSLGSSRLWRVVRIRQKGLALSWLTPEPIEWCLLFRPGWWERSWATRHRRSTFWLKEIRWCHRVRASICHCSATTLWMGSKQYWQCRSTRWMGLSVQDGTLQQPLLCHTRHSRLSHCRCSVTPRHPTPTTMAMRSCSIGFWGAIAPTRIWRYSRVLWMSSWSVKWTMVDLGSPSWSLHSLDGGSPSWAMSVEVGSTL